MENDNDTSKFDILSQHEPTHVEDGKIEPHVDLTDLPAPSDSAITHALLTELVRLQTEQNQMLREAVNVLQEVGTKAEGFLGGNSGKPGLGSVLGKVLLG